MEGHAARATDAHGDHVTLAAYAARMRELGKRKVAVGVMGAKASAEHANSEGATVAEVAAWNHYGTGQISSRPFIALALEKQRAKLSTTLARVAKLVGEGKLDAKTGLGLAGAQLVGEIQQTIADGVAPANADSTIERKGSSTPLIDTGQLRSAIAFEVR